MPRPSDEPRCMGCAAGLPVSDELVHYENDTAVIICTRFITKRTSYISRGELIGEMANAIADFYGLVGDVRENALSVYRREAAVVYDLLLVLFRDRIKHIAD